MNWNELTISINWWGRFDMINFEFVWVDHFFFCKLKNVKWSVDVLNGKLLELIAKAKEINQLCSMAARGD